MKSVIIIGMGKFGRYLAEHMQERGNEVLIVDKDANIINSLSSKFNDAYVGDCTNNEVVKSFGVEHFDICFVTTGESFQSSLEITSLLKENNAKYIIARATMDMQAKFLKQIGADEVVYLEQDTAERLAIKCSDNNIYDYIEISDDYGIYETGIPKSWISHSIQEINVRQVYNINIVAVKNDNKMNSTIGPSYVFNADDHIIIICTKEDAKKLTKRFK